MIRSYKKGFTIIELLIVIVVISVLVSVSTVAYTGVTKKAQQATTEVDLANIEKNIRLYHAKHGYLPATIEEFNEVSTWPINDRMVIVQPWGGPDTMNKRTPKGMYNVYTNKWSDGKNVSMTIGYWNYNEGRWEEIYWQSHTTYTNGEINGGEITFDSYDPVTRKIPCRAEVIDDCLGLDPSVPY